MDRWPILRTGLMSIRAAVALLVGVLWALLAGVASGYEVAEVKQGGTLRGKVRLEGAAPSPKTFTITQDRDVCGKVATEPGVEVSGGGIKNALVMIKEIKKGKAFDFPKPVLDQKGCVFRPHIVLMGPGELTITNSDGVTHNVHTKSVNNPKLNITMPKARRQASATLQQPEIIPAACDAHGWMKAFIVVASHPYYAVTGDGGSFMLERVPPGRYTLEVWHGEMGKLSREVSVEAGKVSEIEFTYKR